MVVTNRILLVRNGGYVFAEERQQQIEQAAVRARADVARQPTEARITKPYPTDPEEALTEARRRQDVAFKRLQALAGTNQDAQWKQAQAEVRQTEEDKSRFLRQLGRLDEGESQQIQRQR